MSTTLISSNPTFKKDKPDHENYLNVAEFFSDTLQGENFVGWPATFLRLKDCTLNCTWCDTTEVWRKGNPYTFDELFDIMEKNDVIKKLFDGQSLILTGGSPLLQQDRLIRFLTVFSTRYFFITIEIENECVLMPHPKMASFISTWNNSPKLANSGMKKELRYKPDVIKRVAQYSESWFKFVIDKEEDWEEIQADFLDAGLIQKSQIVLMPQGQTQEELNLKREWVAEMAIKHNVRFSDRLHVTLWNKKTGV